MNTKIYGTIGPACCDTDTLVRLFEKGMTGIRINLSHSDLSEAEEWLSHVHAAFRKYLERQDVLKNVEERHKKNRLQMKKAEILMDLRGPELRIGKLSAEQTLEEGKWLTLVPEDGTVLSPAAVPVPKQVLEALVPEQEISLDDGKLLLRVEEVFPLGLEKGMDKTPFRAKCRILRGGLLKSGKSIALPGMEVSMPTLTQSDLENIAVAGKYGITGVMLPFVRSREDLINLRSALCKAGVPDIRIFAKIENINGVLKLPELFRDCDEIVIARGDLGNAVALCNLPVVQRQIAKQCRKARQPFMVVTQMLASMEHAAVPTRAEVSDIFRAVEEGAASVMLTGETAAGDYPVEAMEYMVHTVQAAEKYLAAERMDINYI